MEYMHKNDTYKQFIDYLYQHENEEDCETKYSQRSNLLQEQSSSFPFDKNILSKPSPKCASLFDGTSIPYNIAQNIKFKRIKITNEERIKWTKERITILKNKLYIEELELKEMELRG